VASVGAFRSPFNINYNLVDDLVRLGFKGKISPFNPNAEEI
jgi:hypothetical protein